jgi:hypothetical protein
MKTLITLILVAFFGTYVPQASAWIAVPQGETLYQGIFTNSPSGFKLLSAENSAEPKYTFNPPSTYPMTKNEDGSLLGIVCGCLVIVVGGYIIWRICKWCDKHLGTNAPATNTNSTAVSPYALPTSSSPLMATNQWFGPEDSAGTVTFTLQQNTIDGRWEDSSTTLRVNTNYLVAQVITEGVSTYVPLVPMGNSNYLLDLTSIVQIPMGNPQRYFQWKISSYPLQ